ncbi:STAS domain-containing protein [Pseudobacteroides cellulosolvens]|uniref:Sulfate transporter/antisigma-factor antagonist STAS n=1 Tax=Pseudobacteroides cellulosolvens ATCC 35603 = DSM 2933 TaxID=398512 RepID=A0A0L6JVV0_9FIRM|nr:STAS domain-containing protein [Pseudobacteroides cellulosolvens]KNY29963.1 Sulfate transporter/antisigma-factor antagonist STAS [Pseudobacteroides cellulosolvens ATCC 35603 = DSM 2933]
MNKDLNSDILLISESITERNQIIKFNGCLVFNTSQMAKAKINKILIDAEGYILDFSGITKIDSAGFGVIFNFMSKKPQKSAVVAVVKDLFIIELFKVTKVDQILPLCSSIEDAAEIIDFMMVKNTMA